MSRISSVVVLLVTAALAVAGLAAGPRSAPNPAEAAVLAATGTPGGFAPAPTSTPTRTPGGFAPAPTATPTRTATRTPTPGSITVPPSPTPTRTPLNITGPSPTNTPPSFAALPTLTPTPTFPVAGPPELKGDIVPVRIELVQSVYRAGNDPAEPAVPLLSGKGSLVRVWVDLTGEGGSRNVTVQLKAFRNGAELPPCLPFTNQVTQVVNKPTAVQRPISPYETVNFTLPRSCGWLDGNSLTLQAKVIGVECTQCLGNNIIQRSFSLVSVRPMKVQMTWIRVNDIWPPINGKGLDYIYSQWPISDMELTSSLVLAPDSVDLSGGIPQANDFDNPFWTEYGQLINAMRDCCTDDDVDVHFGIVHQNLVSCYGFGGGGWALSGENCGGTFAHEGGHAFSLDHASDDHNECDGGACEGDFPFDHGRINNYGWNELRPNEFVMPDLFNAWHSHDTMSYGGCPGFAPGYNNAFYAYCTNWLSTLNYGRMAHRLMCANPQGDVPNLLFEPLLLVQYAQCFNVTGPFAPFVQAPWGGIAGHDHSGHALQGAPAPALSASAPAQTSAARGAMLRVSGVINPDGTASFGPFYHLADGSLRVGGNGETYQIASYDSSGRELARRGFATPVTYAHVPQRLAANFAVALPWRPDVHRVVLFRSGQVLAERTISANAPQIRIVSPVAGTRWPNTSGLQVEWDTVDADGDPVVVWIEHGDPATGTWRTLYRGASGNSHTFDPRSIPGGARKLRLHASDGMHTTTVELDGTLNVENRAPLVSLSDPETTVIEEGEAAPPGGYAFTATAFDLEDGRLSGSAIVWTSNRQGKVGEGESILVRNLQSGEHTITVTATDKDGATGSESFRVTARIPAPQQLSPRDDQVLGNLTANLRWTPPSGARWLHLQVVPANGDGPGVDLLQSDLDFIQRGTYNLPEPQFGQPGSLYLMLPGMGYTWRLRYARTTSEPAEEDWSSWSEARFRTPDRGSGGISVISPANGAQGVPATPQLVWTNTDPSVFYYEVQVSRDPTFNTDPQTATAMVYWVLIHGAVANPPNSYQIPAAFPLEPGATYHARVRPRIQGDGDPAAWSAAVSFTTG